MAERQANWDGITTEEIDTTFKVLETIRQNLSDDGMRAEAAVVNEAHYLVQQYDEGSNWMKAVPTTRTPHYWTPNEGEIMNDPQAPYWSSGDVRITEVTDTPASEYEIKEDDYFGPTTVAADNPGEPEDAPVVLARYQRDNGGESDEYAFPVTRLDRT